MSYSDKSFCAIDSIEWGYLKITEVKSLDREVFVLIKRVDNQSSFGIACLDSNNSLLGLDSRYIRAGGGIDGKRAHMFERRNPLAGRSLRKNSSRNTVQCGVQNIIPEQPPLIILPPFGNSEYQFIWLRSRRGGVAGGGSKNCCGEGRSNNYYSNKREALLESETPSERTAEDSVALKDHKLYFS
ncbi:hypothetical protein BCR42DRAFT_398658 [Absidia repens]|uniref:Uncharacterized protein n=1 Tax=Absidia repens TaxID=90262 RepID=A0A1X2HXB7_9FUNG|nr:hypothetical protein BCR42DRAFT_398658 [Absidia repens]